MYTHIVTRRHTPIYKKKYKIKKAQWCRKIEKSILRNYVEIQKKNVEMKNTKKKEKFKLPKWD